MSLSANALKNKIKKYAKSNNIPAQVVLQNYMFERFLERLSLSKYSEKFIVKGGVLIASIVGLNTRSTMDLDITLKKLPLKEKQISEAIFSICKIELDDNVLFKIKSVSLIRKDDKYGGYRIKLDAIFDTIITPLSIDVSTGDIIIPSAIKYKIYGIFDDVKIDLWGYNIETILAEKVETILSRGVFSTRPRDFYDVYILVTTQKYELNIFKEALETTAIYRGTLEKINNVELILETISSSYDIKEMWIKYQNKFKYAQNISFENIIKILNEILL